MKDYLSFDASSLVCSSSQMRPELRKSGFPSDFSSYLTRVESSSGFWCVFKKSLYSTQETEFNSTKLLCAWLQPSVFTSDQQSKTPLNTISFSYFPDIPFPTFPFSWNGSLWPLKKFSLYCSELLTAYMVNWCLFSQKQPNPPSSLK